MFGSTKYPCLTTVLFHFWVNWSETGSPNTITASKSRQSSGKGRFLPVKSCKKRWLQSILLCHGVEKGLNLLQISITVCDSTGEVCAHILCIWCPIPLILIPASTIELEKKSHNWWQWQQQNPDSSWTTLLKKKKYIKAQFTLVQDEIRLVKFNFFPMGAVLLILHKSVQL